MLPLPLSIVTTNCHFFSLFYIPFPTAISRPILPLPLSFHHHSNRPDLLYRLTPLPPCHCHSPPCHSHSDQRRAVADLELQIASHGLELERLAAGRRALEGRVAALRGAAAEHVRGWGGNGWQWRGGSGGIRQLGSARSFWY
jgi:hypothetical protein